MACACATPPRDDLNETVRAARLALSADGTRNESDLRELLQRAPVPVLAPGDRTLQRPTLSVGREFAALTGRDGDATLHVQGTRAMQRHPSIQPLKGTHPIRGSMGFVSVNEAIRTASWIENEVAYAVDLECATADDRRCQDDRYLLDLVEHLVVVGGATR